MCVSGRLNCLHTVAHHISYSRTQATALCCLGAGHDDPGMQNPHTCRDFACHESERAAFVMRCQLLTQPNKKM